MCKIRQDLVNLGVSSNKTRQVGEDKTGKQLFFRLLFFGEGLTVRKGAVMGNRTDYPAKGHRL